MGVQKRGKWLITSKSEEDDDAKSGNLSRVHDKNSCLRLC
jgi:hypothetical protein